MPTITSTANASVKAARKLLRRRHRAAAGRFLVESPQVLAAARPHLEEVFVGVEADPPARAEASRAAASGAVLTEVSDSVLRTLSSTSAPRGVVGVARLEEPDLDTVLRGARCVLLCCEVADPGNLGAIIRTADAAGVDGVVTSADSVDARNPKAVRASAGSIFHLPVVGGTDPGEVLAASRRHGLRPVAVDARGAVAHTDADLRTPTLLVLGGEARGVPDEVLAACDETVRVDMFAGSRPGYAGHAESLNLAATAAVTAFEAVRQRAGAGRAGS